MARSFTLAQLRTKVRERADIENSTFIDDTELNGYISASYARLHELLVQSGIAYFESEQTITTVAGTASYALPAAYYATIGVDFQRSTGQYLPLRRIMVQERNMFPASAADRSFAYRIVGSNVVLYPTPSAVQTYRHLYVPIATNLSADGDTVDGIAGWEELIINDAARKCLAKEESDTSAIEREIARDEARIENARLSRYLADTHRIARVNESDLLSDPDSLVPWEFYAFGR